MCRFATRLVAETEKDKLVQLMKNFIGVPAEIVITQKGLTIAYEGQYDPHGDQDRYKWIDCNVKYYISPDPSVFLYWNQIDINDSAIAEIEDFGPTIGIEGTKYHTYFFWTNTTCVEL